MKSKLCYETHKNCNGPTCNHADKANRALWAACMGNMGYAAQWLRQATDAVAQGQTEAEFVAHAHHQAGVRQRLLIGALAFSPLSRSAGLRGYGRPGGLTPLRKQPL